jgi:hypothetical protein
VSRFDVKQLAELMHLPDCYLPSEILAFGYPEHPQKPLQKKDLRQIVFYNTYR